MAKIVVKETTDLETLKSKSFVVDGNNSLYQFLANIRMRDGSLLRDSQGNVTSHLVGLSSRMTRLISDYGMKLVYVFDGPPPSFKSEEIEKRRKQRKMALEEYVQAKDVGDLVTARKKASASSRLSSDMIGDAKRLLDYLGVPWVQSPSEGEAQAAYLVRKNDVWASNSQDFDSLLFGVPRLVRYLSISTRSKPTPPEIIELDKVLKHNEISREQLVDAAILIGTDFNKGVKGIGPVKAIQHIKKYKTLNKMPKNVQEELPVFFEQIQDFFLNPPINEDYDLKKKDLNEAKLREFLCEEHDFSQQKVDQLIHRMTKLQVKIHKVRSLESFFS